MDGAHPEENGRPEQEEDAPGSLVQKYFGGVPAAVSAEPLHTFSILVGQNNASSGDNSDVSAGTTATPAMRVSVALHRYRLALRFPFGTSHSSTTHRDNALILISLGSDINIAEAGLPPKRIHVYCSDLDDCVEFVSAWEARLKVLLRSPPGKMISTDNPLKSLPPDAAVPLRRFLGKTDVRSWVLRSMLVALDTCSPAMEGCAFASASQAMIEVAIMSSILAGGGMAEKRVHGLLGLNPSAAETPLTFYTVALNDDLAVTLESARFGRSFTPHVKIKLDGDVHKAKKVLDALSTWCEARDNEEAGNGIKGATKTWWSVDANCAWTPDIAMNMLESVLLPHKSRIFMVEQPFPVELTVNREGEGSSGDDDSDSILAWKRIKELYSSHGFRIFADESMRTAEDVPRLLGLVDGVNIKMEKCGGYRGGLRAAYAARNAGLDLWIGCMVGSSLNSGGAAELVALPGVVGCDLDGAALVTEDSKVVSGGFKFIAGGHISIAQPGARHATSSHNSTGQEGPRKRHKNNSDGLGMIPISIA